MTLSYGSQESKLLLIREGPVYKGYKNQFNRFTPLLEIDADTGKSHTITHAKSYRNIKSH